MNFNLVEALDMLERTPKTLACLLSGLAEGWLHSVEGEGTWTPVEVVEHLIEADRFNWVPRFNTMLADGEKTPFPAFDRFSHLKRGSERGVEEALSEFQRIRMENLSYVRLTVNADFDLEQSGLHPEFGVVRISELISAWVVHDLTHISQIVRVMAERYRADVGPWVAYLGILNKK